MHRIKRIEVTNFKAIRNASFEFSNYSPLVGYNNAGKSSVLEALAWAIKPSSIPLVGFNDRNAKISVSVDVTGISTEVLDGLGASHRARIEAFVENRELRFRRTQMSPAQSSSQILLEIFDPLEASDWVVNPTGISAALNALFPEVIIVGAMENSAEDVGKNTSSTTIGKLIKQIVDPVRVQFAPEIVQNLMPIADQLSARGPNKHATLQEVDGIIETYLASFFPGMSAKTHIPMPDIDDILKKATIQVSETRYGDDLEGEASTMGHGAQRSVQIALINALAHIRRGDVGEAGRTILLLLDEPELYLHPQAIAVVRSALKQLSTSGFQVVFTTHTGELISPEDAGNTIIVRRTAEAGCVPLRKMANVAEVFDDAEQQANTLFELSNSREFLFSDRVLLVEGQTETTVFPELYQIVTRRTPLEDRVGLIRMNGSGSLKRASDVLKAMGLSTCILADLDYAFRVAPFNGLLGVDDERLNEVRRICARMRDKGMFDIADDGYPKKGSICSAEIGFSRLAQEAAAKPIIAAMLDDLRNQDVWLWKGGAIEAHIGVPNKDLSAQRAFVERVRIEGNLDSLPDSGSIEQAVEFVRG